MADHDWRRHGPFLACVHCKKLWRQEASLEPCPKPPKPLQSFSNPSPRKGYRRSSRHPHQPRCAVCHLPLEGNDLECYLETGGEVNTHLSCAK